VITPLEKLRRQAPILTDGAWGTELQELGLETGDCPDVLNLQNPGCVEQVARAYVEAGSQIILTNTFRSNRIALAHYNLAEKTSEMNRAGVEISRRAADGCAYVFASVGPSGKLLMTGDVSEEDLRVAFGEQVRALAAAGADGLVLETMIDLAEAKLAVAAARETGLPVVVCMAFDSGKNQDRTMMGIAPEQAARELTAAGADVIGANCGGGIDRYLPVCSRLAGATDRPIWIKPNAGLPELVGDRVVYKTLPEEFASFGPALVEAGATFVGGCCGTTPEFIRALSRVLGKTSEK
jgi:5-methyltetrahydrofolate--homocysteine methyltransferase